VEKYRNYFEQIGHYEDKALVIQTIGGKRVY